MTDDTIRIRPLHALDEMAAAVDLQQVYWGSGSGSVIPAHMLFSLAAHGGHVLAALDGDRQVGVLVGLLGADTNAMRDDPAIAHLYIYSKRMVVLPDYRGRGLGTRLKLAQRDFALSQGIERVVWTFDPLLAPNAHLNLRKLGGISRTYHKNYYGTQNVGGLSSLGASDRLYLEWWVARDDVAARISGQDTPRTLSGCLDAGALIINPTHIDQHGNVLPVDSPAIPDDRSRLLVEIPINYAQIERTNPALAERWRAHNRATLGWLLDQGYTVIDLIRETDDERPRVFYLLGANETYA